jgi:hypothetical protein
VDPYENVLGVHDAKEDGMVSFAAGETEFISEILADGVVPDVPSLLQPVESFVKPPDVRCAGSVGRVKSFWLFDVDWLGEDTVKVGTFEVALADVPAMVHCNGK